MFVLFGILGYMMVVEASIAINDHICMFTTSEVFNSISNLFSSTDKAKVHFGDGIWLGFLHDPAWLVAPMKT